VKVRLEPTHDSRSEAADVTAESRRMASKIAVTVIEKLLHLLHPMTPFVTEALWSHLKSAGFVPKSAPDLIVAPWPTGAGLPAKFGDAVTSMDALQALTSALRNLRVKNGVEERAAVNAHVRLPDAKLVAVLTEAKPWFERLARCTLAGFSTTEKRPAEADADVVAMAPFGAAELYLPLGGLVDKEARKRDLAAKIEKLKQQTGAIDAKLANEGFVARAPADVVARERERLAQLQDEIGKLSAALKELGG